MITEHIDFALVVLYLFWAFFFWLIYTIRREDRREGYPLEADSPRRVGRTRNYLIPPPKRYVRPDGSTYDAPNFERDEREFPLQRAMLANGNPSEPVGDPMLASVGPGAYAEREHHVELLIDGRDQIVPMRTDEEYSVVGGADVRGWDLMSADGEVAGKITDIWVDRADMLVRYLEFELSDAAKGEGEGGARLVPIQMGLVRSKRECFEVEAMQLDQFKHVPTLAEPTRATVDEEERIGAYYAGARLYATKRRREPLV
ncbi:MAG: photosynthetic reaction center subunit H [Myxococcota bacterium]